MALMLCLNPIFAQIKGTVVDNESAEPVSGAIVLSEKESVVTDKKGAFFLKKETTQLIISHLGYRTDTLKNFSTSDSIIIRLKPTNITIDEITIRGNFNEFPIMELPSSVGYIPDLSLSAAGNLTFAEILNSVPGVFVHSGTANTNRITVRGIGTRTPYGTNRIKAYYNNIPLTTGDGTTEIEDLTGSGIGSVEILKGAKSALYGSGLGGVIMLNKPAFAEGIHAKAKFGISSYKTHKEEVGFSYKQKNVYLSGNYTNTQSDGWRQNSKYDRTNFMLNSGFVNNKNRLDVLLLYIKTKAYIPSSINKNAFSDSPQSAAQNWFSVKGHEDYSKLISGISYQYLFSQRVNNKTSLFVQSYQGYESRPFNILDDEAVKLGFRNITTMSLNALKIQAGFEALFETYDWEIYETLGGEQGNIQSRYSEKRQPLSLFLNGQYRFKNKLIIEAGISLNTLSYQLDDNFDDPIDLSGNFTYDLIYSPFVGVNLPINKSLRVYSSLSHGFSAPSVEETLLPEGEINPDLKPETGINAELGMRLETKNKRLFADIGLFTMSVNNLLLTKRESEEVFYGANAGKSLHQGIEFSGKFLLNKAESTYPVSVQINYSLLQAKFTDFIDDGIDYTGKTLPGIPKHTLYALADIKSPFGIYFVPVFQYTGKQYMNDSNTETYEWYNLLHLKAGFSRKLKKLDVDVSLGIRNLFDNRYASMVLVNAPSYGGSLPRYYYPGMPRNYTLSVSIKL